tara:strand:+ start:228 stop:440 length:213 start_codon:yes stop_codon:yes gene_type:complete
MSKKYKVKLNIYGTITEQVTMTLEADSHDEATKKAMYFRYDQNLWDGKPEMIEQDATDWQVVDAEEVSDE